MHATKLVNKKLLNFLKRFKHLKMRITLSYWAKNVFISNEKRFLTPSLKGVKKIPLIMLLCGGKRTTLESQFLLLVRQENRLQASRHTGISFVLLEQLASLSDKWSTLKNHHVFCKKN